jgi:hybrid cluster-associated redox disulfide protein
MDDKPRPDQISPDMIIARILECWPQTIPVFNHYRMSCVGCTMSEFETLSSAAEIYHLPLENLLTDLSACIQPEG